jgi:lactoylglutathione lyase
MLLDGNIKGVQHLGIMVPDIEQAKAWYVEKMDCTVHYEPIIETNEGNIKLAFLDLNGMVIELVQLVGEGLEEVKSRRHGHIDHFAIDVLDIEKAVQERLEAGAVLEQSTPDGPVSFPLFSQGVKYVFLEGSSGEKVELNQALHLDATRREKNTGGWSHLGIPSTDIDISRQFYSQFGFEEIAYAEVEVDDGTIKVAFMEKDGFVLEFYQLAGEALNDVSNRSDGLIDHIALDVDNVDKAYAELKAAGIDLVEDAPVPLPLFENGVKYFMIRGPDGEKVEFNEMIK